MKIQLAGASAAALIAAACPVQAATLADKAEATIPVTGLKTVVTTAAGTKTNTPLIDNKELLCRRLVQVRIAAHGGRLAAVSVVIA